MNFGTKLRTVLRIVVSLNTAIYAVSTMVTDLGFTKLTTLWAILTVASDFAVAAVTTYYNNDYTETANEYTQVMRLAKKKEDLPEDFWEGGEEND